MRRFFQSLRLSLRLAQRSSWRAKGQSALIVILILIPVAAVSGVITFAQSRIATVAEQNTTRLGQSQAQLEVVSPPDPTLVQEPTDPTTWQVQRDDATGRRTSSDAADPLGPPIEALPAGTRLIEVRDSALVTVATATGRGALLYVEGEVWDPALKGAYQLLSGRAPNGIGEAVVTPATLDRLGQSIGDTISVFDPLGEVTIVGTISDSGRADSAEVIYAPVGTLPLGEPTLKGISYFLPDTPISWDTVTELNANGYIIWSRQVYVNPPPIGSYPQVPDGQRATQGLIIGITVIAAFEIVLLAGAAFAVGARREQRTLALLGSVGANRRHLFQVITANGVVLGAVAGLVGVLVGVAGSFLAYRIADTGNRVDYPAFHINWVALALVIGSAVVAGWAASIVPAILASKFDVVAALRSASRPPRTSRRLTITGLTTAAVGVAGVATGTAVLVTTPWVRTLADSDFQTNPVMVGAVITIVVASLLLLTGLLFLTPALLSRIAALSNRAGLAARLATRDLARNTGRAVPVIGVIIITTFVAIVTMSVQAYQSTVTASYLTDSGLPGQGYLPIFSSSDDPEIQTRTPASGEQLAQVVRENTDVDSLRIIQRPETDWTAWVNQSGTFTEIRPVRPPGDICPSDLQSPSYPATSDPIVIEQHRQKYLTDARCDIRNNPILFNSSGPGVFHVLIGNPDDLAMITGNQVPETARTLLAKGGAIHSGRSWSTTAESLSTG